MRSELIFAMNECDPDTVAVVEFSDICWPINDVDRARRDAKQIGVFGFWRLKHKKPGKP